MVEENHKPRNTIRPNGIPPRSRILDAISSDVGIPRWDFLCGYRPCRRFDVSCSKKKKKQFRHYCTGIYAEIGGCAMLLNDL